MKFKEQLQPKGYVEFFVTKGRPTIVNGPLLYDLRGHKVYKSAEIDFSNTTLIDKFEKHNIIFNQGKDTVIESLTTGFIKVIARMGIGDRGTLPSDSTIPKVPVATMTGLYNEVYRADVDTTVLNVGTPTLHEVKFIKTFSSLDIPLTSFSNQANPVVNEINLVMADLLSGNPLPRPPVSYPGIPDADELSFSMRTFKSIPFDAATQVSITIRYSIFIEA